MKAAAIIAAIGLATRLLDFARAAYDKHHLKRDQKRAQRELEKARKAGEL